jgi:23S rRNA (guanosine2251-2'-O)-methyltransferase
MAEDFITGFHAVIAALQQHEKHVTSVYLDRNRNDQRSEKVSELAHQTKIKIQRVPKAKLDQLVEQGGHQGVVARMQSVRRRNEKDLPDFIAALNEDPFFLILDCIQDPHNLGACMRSAAAAGVQAVIMPKDKSAPISAVARKAASGAVESLAIFQVTNLARTLEILKQEGVWIFGTAGEADVSVYDTDLTWSMALVMGAEGKGMRKQTRELCDFLMYIPLSGSIESLNVSVATGVCLYEAVRQRSQL